MPRLVAILILMLLLAHTASAAASPRFRALSMLETGDRDTAIGRCGEVSRYQIMPRYWRRYGGGDASNPTEALRVAERIMQERVARFVRQHHRQPLDAEVYRLWNPGCGDCAGRYANLVERFTHE